VANHSSSAAASAFFKATVDGSSINLYKLTAKNKGAWGNGISVVVAAGQVAASASVLPTFSLSILVGGLEVERWSELSVDPTSSRYIDTIMNNYSSYLSVSDIALVAPSVSNTITTGTTALLGGSDGAAVTDSDYVAAFPALDLIDTDILLNVPGVYSSTVVNGALAYAESRGNGFVIIDPNPSATSATDIIWYPDGFEWILEGGDDCVVSFANTDHRTIGAQVTLKRVA
jgi:hypothetical protein